MKRSTELQIRNTPAKIEASDMTDETPPPSDPATALQQQLERANQRLVQAELKSHAIKAGIIDLDCLQMLDTSALQLDDNGNIPGAEDALNRLKHDKPWLFSKPNSSHLAPAPSPEAPQTRMAKDMTHREWQVARERLIRGR